MEGGDFRQFKDGGGEEERRRTVLIEANMARKREEAPIVTIQLQRTLLKREAPVGHGFKKWLGGGDGKRRRIALPFPVEE